MLQKNFEIQYLLNSAVLITYGAERLLIDGLFSDKQPFDKMNKDTEKHIIEGSGGFENIHFLLFTHCHNDHYNGSKARRFLENNKGVRVILPPNARLEKESAELMGSSCFTMKGQVGQAGRFSFNDLEIEFMKTEHITFNYPEHYAINIVSPTENITFTADMDFNRISDLKGFTKREHSVIFMNHLSMLHKRWRRELLGLDYDKIYFYHLPSEANDDSGYREKAFKNWQKYGMDFPMAELLQYNG